MYNCTFISTSGEKFYFGYDYGTIFDLDPLGELEVELSTSQGFMQTGNTVEAEVVNGVSRTITGVFIDYTDSDLAQAMNDMFAPGVHGVLYFNSNYYCECVVQKSPAILLSNRKRTFSLMLYCPYPYWLEADSSQSQAGGYTAAFQFPVCYDSHQYGIANADLVNCYNSGAIATFYDVVFTTEAADVTNYGIRNIYTDEILKLDDTLSYGESVHVYREEGRLKVEKTVDGETSSVFSLLDEDSTLFKLESGDNYIEHFADSNSDDLDTLITIYPAHAGVIAT